MARKQPQESGSEPSPGSTHRALLIGLALAFAIPLVPALYFLTIVPVGMVMEAIEDVSGAYSVTDFYMTPAVWLYEGWPAYRAFVDWQLAWLGM